MKKLNKVQRLGLAAGFAAMSAGSALAEGFDPATSIATATTTVTAVVTGVGALLAAAVGLYVAFIGYRKLKESLNKA